MIKSKRRKKTSLFDFEIKERTTESLEEINALYQKLGYSGTASPNDKIFLIRFEQEVCAVVRICAEENSFVLRGMYVAPGIRGKGLGKLMLKKLIPYLDSLPYPCYCIPHDHLISFYAEIHFRQIDPDSAPWFLKERLHAYLEKGLRVVLLEREVNHR